MKNGFTLLFIVLVMTWLTSESSAQSCVDNLEDASRAYYNGNFQTVIALLGDCNYSALSQNSKSDVFELLIKAHLLLDDEQIADSLMNVLLEDNPLYVPRQGDVLIYRELHGSYTIDNQWNFGFIAGFNQPEFNIKKYQSISSVVREPLNYATKPGLIIGINGELLTVKNFYLSTGLIYETYSYSYSEIILEYQQLDVAEKMSLLNVPLSVRFELPVGKFKPYVRAGISGHFLLNAALDLDLRAIPTEIPVPFSGVPYKTNDYDVSFQRKSSTMNYHFGLGLRRSIGTYHIELAATYEFGTQNLIEVDKRFTNEELLNTYFYVPDDINLSNLKFTFGIYKAILKPKKKR